MTNASEEPDDGLVDVLYYGEWWDCPRTGVTFVAGVPMHFDCTFSDDLDEYPAEFRLWPATDSEVRVGMDAYEEFAAWRARYDSGANPPPVNSRPQRAVQPAASARLAVPEWQLDPDRSYARRIPRHRVRWHFID